MTLSFRRRTVRNLLAACGAALALGAMPARADEADTQQWTLLTFQRELTSRWRLYFEVQPRFGQDLTDGDTDHGVERLLVRPAVGYRLNSKVSIWQGYGWTPLMLPRFADEHRLFQQLLYEDRFGKTAFVNRARLEERFIEGAGGTAVRLRNMVRFAHPISKDERWAAVLYDELFWNLNSTDAGPVSGFDRNRLFLGVSRQVNRQLRVETGYLMEVANLPRSSEERQLNVWLVWLAFTP